MEHDRGLPDEVIELQRFDEIGVPDQRTIGDGKITQKELLTAAILRKPSSSTEPLRKTEQ